MAFDHVRGVYEPSETTGRGAHACTLFVVLAGAGLSSWWMRADGLRRSIVGVVVVVLAIAGAVTMVELFYFRWMHGDFAGRMADFTRSTLGARGDDPMVVDAFAESIRESWRLWRILTNTFLLVTVWGTLLGLTSLGIVRSCLRFFATEAHARTLNHERARSLHD